jgi:hypothetical protein
VVLIFGVLTAVDAAHAVAYFVSRSLSGSSDATQADGDAGRKAILKLRQLQPIAVTLDHTDHRCRDTGAVHQSGFSTLLCEVGQPHCKAL